MKRILGLTVLFFFLTGCSVFGKTGVEEAPYQVIQTDDQLDVEVRYYKQLVLVTAPMNEGMDASKKEPFQKLFDYISGNNFLRNPNSAKMEGQSSNSSEQIQVDTKGQNISMTAPVFMEPSSKNGIMSFVLPSHYNIETAPVPKDPNLALFELKNTHYAVIRFSGLLRSENINENLERLQQWMKIHAYTAGEGYKVAGYNPPFTIPALRRNEILIPIVEPLR